MGGCSAIVVIGDSIKCRTGTAQQFPAGDVAFQVETQTQSTLSERCLRESDFPFRKNSVPMPIFSLAIGHQATRSRIAVVKASPSKARRRGLRRPTSALTTTILGVVVTASTVWAQQSTPAGSDPRSRSTPPDGATAESAPLYGMTTSRGARYLLRNGLDYLGYQQYDRALKFLREAETRKKELNDAEKLALKQGIERAQRGLREASDAQSPYALSERSQHRSGFSPAKAETQVAAGATQATLPASKTRIKRAGQPDRLANDGDDQGEPIRLASGETPDVSIPQNSVSPRSASTTRPELDQPRTFPEIPKLSAASQRLELTENGPLSEQRPVTDDSRRPVTEPGTAQLDSPAVLPPLVPATEQARPAEVSVADRSNQGTASAGSEAPQVMSHEAADANLETGTRAESMSAVRPTPVGGPGVEHSPALVPETGTQISAVPSEAAPAPRVTSTPCPVPQKIEAPTSNGVVQPSPGNETSQASPNPAAIILETIPSSMPAVAAAQPASTDAEAHKETEDAGPATLPDPVRDVAAVPTAAITRQTAPPVDNDQLPPLPTDIARPAAPGSTPETAPTPSAASNSAAASGIAELPPPPGDVVQSASPKPAADTSPTPPAAVDPTAASPRATDELPPLPADIAQSASSKPTSDDLAPSLVAPTPLLVSPNRAPDAAQTPTDATNSPADSSGGVDNSAPSHAGEDVRQPLHSDNGALTSPSSAPGSNENVDGGSSAATLQTVPREPNPATNANLAEAPAAAPGPGNGTGVDLDASSIPPAIEDQEPIGSNSKSIAGDRPNSRSILRPDLKREVEMIARNQEAASRSQRTNDRQPGAPVDTSASDPRTQFQLDTSRAPSPAEARPIRAIPVPEDWVPLAPRNWSPQRKYWAAAATCHLPLYFQDPVLERYGHSVEQFVGPIGRFLTYPVDDPTQSVQRNQILQPFFSWGLFGLQIAAWPYNLIMDPPWETQYDLGYYRPGDNIPTDTYWLPLHGYGPPLHGSRY